MNRKSIAPAVSQTLILAFVTAVAAIGAPSQDESAQSVSGTIDGKEFVWEVPDPDSDSCSVFMGTFRVSFQATDESSAVLMGNSLVRVELPDGNGYLAIRDPLNSSAFNDAISVEGKTVTYSGKMQFGPLQRAPGAKVVEVDATITARCQ